MFKKDKGKELHKELAAIRKNIPDKYNQVLMLDYLDDPDVDLMFSITTRSDGKTFNYLYALAELNIKFDFTTLSSFFGSLIDQSFIWNSPVIASFSPISPKIRLFLFS